jgi:hypothetical protein
MLVNPLKKSYKDLHVFRSFIVRFYETFSLCVFLLLYIRFETMMLY